MQHSFVHKKNCMKKNEKILSILQMQYRKGVPQIEMKKQTVEPKKDHSKISAKEFFLVHNMVIKELFAFYPGATIGILLLSIVSVGINFTELKLLEFITNNVSYYIHGTSKNFVSFMLAVALFFTIILILLLLTNAYRKIKCKYQNSVIMRSEKQLILTLSNIPYEYFESSVFYEKISLAKQACQKYGNAIYSVTEIFRIVTMLIIYGVLLTRLSPWFSIIIILATTVSSFFAAKITDKQLDYWRTHVSPEARHNGYFRGIFGSRINHAVIQTERSFSYFKKRYHYYNSRERKNYLKLNLLSLSSELLTTVLFIATFGATALIVATGVVEARFEIGFYSMIIAMVIQLFQEIKAFSSLMLRDNWYVRIMHEYYEVINLSQALPFNTQDSQNYIIHLQDVSYSYPQSEKVALSDINTTFAKGEKIAIVGLNGSGKTTLISIILGLLRQHNGTVFTKDAVITAILQDFVQYQMSIKENIEVGNGGNHLSEEEILEILEQIELKDTVLQLPDGIHTKLGQLEQGIELSKGQWQRLAIGRLLANKRANVWILDEPTAYLDPLSEINMYNYIFNLAGDRLVFFISHRLGFARKADRIIVIDNGKIVESGTHFELMQHAGIYATMFSSQKEWYV